MPELSNFMEAIGIGTVMFGLGYGGSRLYRKWTDRLKRRKRAAGLVAAGNCPLCELTEAMQKLDEETLARPEGTTLH